MKAFSNSGIANLLRQLLRDLPDHAHESMTREASPKVRQRCISTLSTLSDSCDGYKVRKTLTRP